MTSEIGTVALGDGNARPGWAEGESEPVIASPSIEPLALYLSGPCRVFGAFAAFEAFEAFGAFGAFGAFEAFGAFAAFSAFSACDAPARAPPGARRVGTISRRG
ncbi:MAG TPA: hypothetical protein VJR91_13265 [Burkholderia sp.]|nr:hypothetical protein [Burkholderia sp.]